jgi:hypothetical protein
MEPHSDDGTQRLELPVSRTTLKTWGGVPTEISEKSIELLADGAGLVCSRLTLSVQEVADWHSVLTIAFEGGVLEHMLSMSLWSDAHVFLAKSLCVSANVGGSLSSMSICAW